MSRRNESPRPMRVRQKAAAEGIMRCLLLGWAAERIARRLGVTARTVRYKISTTKFQTAFEQRQREHFKPSMLG